MRHFIPSSISSPSTILFRSLTLTSTLSSPSLRRNLPATAALFTHVSTRKMSTKREIKPAARVSSNKQDVWSLVNEAAAAAAAGGKSVTNLGQGFFGYNPPKFVLDAAKEVLDRVECNQYSPTRGRPRLLKALSDAYSPFFGRTLDPNTEIVVTTGANEGTLAAFMGFVEEGDEVIVMEPFFDQYIHNIQMAGGKVVYVPLHPPKDGSSKTCSSKEWTLDIEEFKSKITPKTKMMIINTPHNPIGKIFTKEELKAITDVAVEHNIIIVSDEVYDRLYYTDFTRVATISPEVENLTITVGSGGKTFNATGWRVGWLIGKPHLIKPASVGHTQLCYSSVSPLQEATAIGLEKAESENYWEYSVKAMKHKMDLFNEIWDELGIPYTIPDGGYFVLANFSKLRLPEDYPFPPSVQNRARDFKLCWWFIKELGVAAIPPTEFYTDANAHMAEDYLRFAVCKEDSMLEEAKEKLRKLKPLLG